MGDDLLELYVRQVLEALRRHSVNLNILCTVHAANADRPVEVYRFFRDELKADFVQLIPIVERATDETLSLLDEAGASARTAIGRSTPKGAIS